MPPALLRSTVLAALHAATGEALTAAAVSSTAAALSQEVAQTMIRHHVTLALLGVAALTLIGGGAGVYALQSSSDSNKSKPSSSPAPEITNQDRAAAALKLLDAKSRLARARTRSLIAEYKRLKAFTLRQYYGIGMMVVQAGDADKEARLNTLIDEIKKVSDNPADQIAALQAWLQTINDYEHQALAALPLRPGINPQLDFDFDIDRASAEVALAELKATNPGVQPSSWVSEANTPIAPSRPPKEPENPEDEAQNALILEALRKPIPIPFPEPTSLSDILTYLRDQTSGDPLTDGIPIYVDPVELQEWDDSLTLDSPSFQLELEGIPLKTTLQLLLSQRNLTYKVRHGLLSISSRPSYDPKAEESASAKMLGTKVSHNPPDWTTVTGPIYPTESPLYGLDDVTPADQERTNQVQIALRKTLPMPFASETPLQDVLAYVREKTTNDTFPSGLPIYLDPTGLESLELTPDSKVRIDLAGVRLKTTLNLLLKQLDLVYVVRQGVIIITSPDALQSMPNPNEQSEFVQQLHRNWTHFMGGMGGGLGGGGFQ